MDATMVLEYLKVLLTAPVTITLAIITFFAMFRGDVKALMARIARVRFPGGEIETSQLEKIKEEIPTKGDRPELIAKEGANTAALPATAGEGSATADTIAAERARAALWEYRYLNYFLVRNTQNALDWFAASHPRATTSLFNAAWLPLVPSPNERTAMLSALETHQLITIANGLIEVTPKGREYIQWRGPLPPPAS